MADEDYAASPEQKLTIASYFIMASPTGEVDEVVKDVKTMVNDSATLDDNNLRNIMHNYNTSRMVSAEAPDGTQVMVSPYGEVDAETYLDPATGKVLKFDHLNVKFTEETDQKQVLADHIAGVRSAIEESMKSYLKGMYKDGKWSLAVYGTDDNKVTICISAHNTRLSSFWTGGWTSVYTLDVGSQGDTEVAGNIKVNVHYFEDGNVQLHSDFEKKSSVTVSDASSTGKAVALAIETLEYEFHKELELLYVDMHANTFKAMRRFLPLSRQKMNWVTGAHSLASEITK